MTPGTLAPMTLDLGNSTTAVRLGPREPPADMVVTLSAEDRARGQWHPDVLRRAHVAFHAHGCLLLRGLFPPAAMDAMHLDYVSRYGALDKSQMLELGLRPVPNPIRPSGDGRFEITLRMNGAFLRPDVFANPLLRGVLAPMLGADMQLNSFVIVVSYPGAPMQEIHRDHGHLFVNEPDLGPNLPVYAVNCVVPLMDVDMQIGPTGVWPGSHRWPTPIKAQPDEVTACPLRRGDCMLLDYRTLHTGLPNQSARVRPILYVVYARGWFTDEATHFGVNSPDLWLEDYKTLPESTHIALYRALSQTLRNQGRGNVPVPGTGGPVSRPADPPSKGKVGRNDPCPCGSGRKYKQCHGRQA
jgi:hypothetical protein